MRRALASAFSLLLASALPALAAKPAWDQAANVKEAAERLSKLHRASGAQGVVKFLDACYRTHTLASKYTAGLEACMAQDYMHSKVLAMIYSKIPQDARAKQGLPAPEAIAQGMGQRMGSVFQQYKFTPADAEALRQSVDKHGFPIFLKAVFPQAEPQPKSN